MQPSGPALPATSSSPVDQPAATGADADTAEQSVTANGSQVAVVEVELAMAAAINALIATQAARKGAVHEQLKFVGEHILRAAADGSVPTAEGVPDGHTAETAAGLRNDVWASAPARTTVRSTLANPWKLCVQGTPPTMATGTHRQATLPC